MKFFAQNLIFASVLPRIPALTPLLVLVILLPEGLAEIKEKKTSVITIRWKRGLLRYTAKLKIGFYPDSLDYKVDDTQNVLRVALPSPRIQSCEIYNRKFYKPPLEKAENVRSDYDIIEDFSCYEVLAFDDEARNNALKNANAFCVLDLLRDKTELAFENQASNSGKMVKYARQSL